MPDNPYTRSTSVTITELVPEHGELPYCSAWKQDGYNCSNRGKYLQNGVPVCGQHLGKPGTIWQMGVEEHPQPQELAQVRKRKTR